MSVIHILKDGTVKHDITGHVVRMADAETVYHLIQTLHRKTVKRKTNNTYKNGYEATNE